MKKKKVCKNLDISYLLITRFGLKFYRAKLYTGAFLYIRFLQTLSAIPSKNELNATQGIYFENE